MTLLEFWHLNGTVMDTSKRIIHHQLAYLLQGIHSRFKVSMAPSSENIVFCVQNKLKLPSIFKNS